MAGVIASQFRVEREDAIADLVLGDLLNDAATLAELMVTEAQRASWLDTYLLAAGLNQLAEDWLHRDLLSLRKVAEVLVKMRLAGRAIAGLALRIRGAGLRGRRLLAGERRAVRWQLQLARLVDELAMVVAGDGAGANRLVERAENVARGLGRVPAGLGTSILRIPSCFRSLDQRPEDLEQLAALFARRWPERSRRLLVIGLRTSGSYLAPLQAAYLRRRGYTVGNLTLRPGQDLLGDDRRPLRAAARGGSLVLICDDPPTSGRALERVAGEVEAAGVNRSNVVLLVALLGDLPSRLAPRQVVALPVDCWRIRGELQPAAVRGALGARSAEPVPIIGVDLKTEVGRRRHARALYRVRWDGGAERLVYAKGLGLGYFGRHTLAVSRAVGEYLPETLAIANGVLFREWLPEEARLGAPEPTAVTAVAQRIASYVADRAQRLTAVADRSLLLAGRNPLWQRVADRLGRGFRGARPFVRPALHRLGKRLLAAPQPSIVDGSLALAEWFALPGEGWRKVDYDERAFSNEDLHVYDPAWDLAVAAADAEMEGVVGLDDELRERFERRTGQPIGDVRWLLYRVQHLAGFADTMTELVASGADGLNQALATRDAALGAAEWVLLSHLGDRLLHDVTEPTTGPLCAIDVDGVLETGWLGFSSITPAGMLALRTLLRHGYRPVLVSGRSLPGLIARCRALRLPGAVAEFGAVAYRASDGACRELLVTRQTQALARARRELRRRPGVWADPRWRTVHAYRLSQRGHPRGLEPDLVEAVLAAADGGLRHIPGWAQTNFIPAGIDKAAGLRALVEMIAPEIAGFEQPLALAVGDTEPDLPMLGLAARRWAPANASSDVRAHGVRVASRRFQAGLAEAVADLVGHWPGTCPICRPPQVAGDDRLLLQTLAAQDAGPWHRLFLGWRLYCEARR